MINVADDFAGITMIPFRYFFVVLSACLLATSPSFSADEFVVIHVDPLENEIVAGAIYNPGEFVFVPAGTTVVLMDEAANRYIINGMSAVEIDGKKLAPFRFIPQTDDFSPILDRIFKRDQIETIAGARELGSRKGIGAADHPAWRLHVELLPDYTNGQRYCVAGDVIFKRLERTVPDFVQLRVGDVERTVPFETGTTELRIDNLGLSADAPTKINIKSAEYEGDVIFVPVSSELFEMPPIEIVKSLARMDCTIQALMMSDYAMPN